MTPANGKEIAWNGIRFVVPAAWEPGRIGARHLVIESDAGPAMEIKWGPVKGRFSRSTHLRRLSKLTRARGAALREWVLPQDWQQALARFECTGFAWEAGSEAAVGAILHCPACRTASVVQFFQLPGRSGATGEAAAVLASLRDHRDDGRVAWAVYDILALLPSGFARVRHRFEAGWFHLEFRAQHRTIGLFRRGAARGPYCFQPEGIRPPGGACAVRSGHPDPQRGAGAKRGGQVVFHILRIIQSIPSSKAEPFKLWLAKVGYERIQALNFQK